jgi:hypothetical protein
MTIVSQRSFSGGEISPNLYARTDLEKYVTSLRTCRNFMIMRHGGASNRPGFYYVNETKDSTKQSRLIPFIFNDDQTYAIEVGDQYMRFIRNGAYVEVSGVSAWSNVTAYDIADLVLEGGVYYYCVQAHTNQQPPNATYWYALTGTIYEIPTPYLEADIFKINYDQSADVITLTHPSYEPRELSRTGHTAWTLATITFAPSQAAPTGLAVSGTAGTVAYWVVTAVNDETFEESLATAEVGANSVASSGSPRTLSWTVAAGATNYNVYKKSNGVYGFIGVAAGTSFIDDGIDADTTITPPASRNPFSGSNNYPSTSTYYQQRHGFANTNNNIQIVEFSKSGNFKNFTRSNPLQDDDAVSFQLASLQSNAVKHMLTLGRLVILTAGGEWVIQGDQAGIMKIGEINSEQISYYGCSDLRPIIVGASALFVQARSSIVRDLLNDTVDGYISDDLTIFSSHLFDGYTIVDWTYSQIPDSIVWSVRSDGSMLGFTYIRRQRLFAWHRHDTLGEFESVVSVPEGNEDRLYAVIKRTIDGNTVRYIEQMQSRLISDIKDAIFMDSALTYDGTHTGSTTMTLSGGTTWAYTETLTLTASASEFVAGDVGKQIHLTGSDGTIIRCDIVAYTSNTVVSVKPHKTVPVGMRSVAISSWGTAVKTLSGLDHLEGEEVSVFGDGFVEASPNNASYDTITVSSGEITLSRHYVKIHVGLPYTSDIETLDVDTNQGETTKDKRQLISEVHIFVEQSRGVFAGTEPPTDDTVDPLEGLYEYKQRSDETQEQAVALKTGIINIRMQGTWNTNGRVFIRQVDPLPLQVLSIMPSGYIPFR